MRQAAVWRSLALRLALAVPPLWFTAAVLFLSTLWTEKIIVFAVLAATLAWPAHGLVAVAALVPFGSLIATVAGLGTFRLSEAVVLAFLSGWLLRAPEDRPGPRVPALAGWLLALAVVASIAVQAWQLGRYPGELPRALDLIVHAYNLIGDSIGLIQGARVLEGIALTAAVVTLLRQRPALAMRLPVALASSAALAGAASVLLWRGIAPAEVLARYARIGYRVSAHVGDVNAAGSYFAMTLCLALGVAGRESRKGRLWWMAAALAATGLWLSGAKTAMAAAAVVVPLAAAWTIAGRWRPAARTAFLVVLLIVGIAGGFVRARLLERDPTNTGAGMRQEFNAASLRMIEARPLMGLGIGQYYVNSALFLSPRLAFTYGFENAHNYFLQLGAELGIAGLALFLAWLGVGLARGGRALARAPRDARLLGVTAGVCALLATCLTGHPLLIDEVAFPFWLQFGLMLGLSGSVLLDAGTAESVAAERKTPLASSVACVGIGSLVVIAALISARQAPVEPSASRAVDGFYEWETAEDATRFRWSEQYASIFVPADVTRVYIPVRLPTDLPAVSPVGVEVMTAGVTRGRTLVGSAWAILNIELPDLAPPARFKRVDLRVDRVWQPALYLPGSADMRSVGVQVGEGRLFREH